MLALVDRRRVLVGYPRSVEEITRVERTFEAARGNVDDEHVLVVLHVLQQFVMCVRDGLG